MPAHFSGGGNFPNSERKLRPVGCASSSNGKKSGSSNRPVLTPLPPRNYWRKLLVKIDELCAERDRLAGEQRRKYPGANKVIIGLIERSFR